MEISNVPHLMNKINDDEEDDITYFDNFMYRHN